MSTHTPGPWIVLYEDKTGHPYQIRQQNEGRKIITSWGGISRRASWEGYHNARIIAAAPEMLEILKGCSINLIGTDWHLRALAAIDSIERKNWQEVKYDRP